MPAVSAAASSAGSRSCTLPLLADRDAAILSLAPLVRKLARRIASRVPSTVVDVDDLESAGWMAVIRAVDVFDPSFGVPIEGYAGRVVLGAMYNELRRADPLSERDRRTVRRGSRALHELQHELGREPSSAEIEVRCPGRSRRDAVSRRCRAKRSSSPRPAESPLGACASARSVPQDPHPTGMSRRRRPGISLQRSLTLL